MKCKNCNIDIQYNTTKCPICGASFNGEGLPQLFPKPPLLSNKHSNKISLSFIALLSTLSICLILLIINIFTFKASAWGLIAACCLFLVYFVMFISFNNKISLALRNFLSFIIALSLFYLIGYLLKAMPSVTYIILPNIFALFTIINLLSLLLLNKQNYFFSTLFFSIIGFIPLLLWAFHLPLSFIISIIGFIISIISITITLVINRHSIKLLFSSFFHF